MCSPPQESLTPLTYWYYVYMYCFETKKYLFIFLVISIWSPSSPQDLSHLLIVFTIYNARVSRPNLTTVLVIPSNCRCFKTLKSTVYLYMPFSKLARNHQSFCFFKTDSLLPNKNSAWTSKKSCYTLHLHESLSLSLSS